jgi:hypothetical protein
MAEVLAILLIIAALTAATRSGRNLVRSAHKATGWRTPRSAVHHHSGRFGALMGRGIAAMARAGRRVGTHAALASGRTARRAGQHVATAARHRWQARAATGAARPLLWRTTPTAPSASNGSRPPDPPGNGGSAPAGNRAATSTGGTAPSGSTVTARGTTPAAGAPGGTSQPAATPAGTGTASASATTPTITSAPAGAERNRTPMNRYAINLEHPATDGEFLESCIQLGDVLKSLADQIADWADGLSALNLPQSVLSPLHQVSEGITDAADGATKAATAFENEFEDARDVAARGMHFTGQDAA